MTNTPTSKKKLSEYDLEDLKEFFYNLSRKISSRIILLEIGNDFFNIAVAKLIKNELKINNVFKQELPKEAIEKSIPSDPNIFSSLLLEIFKELKLGGQRVAVALSSDASYTRLIDVPINIEEDNAKNHLEDPDSGIQIPISLNNSDFDIQLTNLPNKKKDNQFYRRYFLTSIPKKTTNIILETIIKSNLELCSIQMSHMCIGNLLRSEINKLELNQLLISIELLDEFTQLIIFDNSGPLFIKRLAAIRKYPSIDEMKEIKNNVSDKNQKKSKKISSDYHPLSKLDLKVLIREISSSYKNFLIENDLNKTVSIFLSGRNSQHKNLVELLGESLSLDISLISPIGVSKLREFEYNPDLINQFSMSRIIGLGLSLMRDDDANNKESTATNNFIIKKFSYLQSNIDSDVDKKSNNNRYSNIKNTSDNKKDTSAEKVTKKEEKKKGNDLPPLPNLDINKKDTNAEKVTKKEEKKKGNDLPPLPNLDINKKDTSTEKSFLDKKDKRSLIQKNKTDDKIQEKFTMDSSFLDID